MPDVLPSIQQYMTFNPLFQVTANLYPLVGCRLVVSVVTHLFDAILGRDDCQVTANGEVVVLADILSATRFAWGLVSSAFSGPTGFGSWPDRSLRLPHAAYSRTHHSPPTMAGQKKSVLADNKESACGNTLR